LEIGETERNHAPGKCDNAGTDDYTQNPEQRTFRELARHRCSSGLRNSDWGIARCCNGGRGHHQFHYCRVRTVTTAEMPGRSFEVRVASSSAILTGTRCTTFVKFPVALSGGSKANCEPLAGAISSTLPLKTFPG